MVQVPNTQPKDQRIERKKWLIGFYIGVTRHLHCECSGNQFFPTCTKITRKRRMLCAEGRPLKCHVLFPSLLLPTGIGSRRYPVKSCITTRNPSFYSWFHCLAWFIGFYVGVTRGLPCKYSGDNTIIQSIIIQYSCKYSGHSFFYVC